MHDHSIPTARDFIESLSPSQRTWYLTEQAGKERLLQHILLDLGRTLSGVAAAHSDAVYTQQSSSAKAKAIDEC